MKESSKLENYQQQMEAHGVSRATSFPPLWRLLWSCNIAVAPPPFVSFVPLAALTGGCFGPLFAFGAWLMGNRGTRSMPVEDAAWIAAITGLAFGLALASYYRHLAHKHRLGSWAEFSGSLLRPKKR